MMLMAAGTDLLVIFLALELMSLSLYVLAGTFRTPAEGNEAALKYFLLGAFASGFFLYGIALLYGATGTTNLARLGMALAAPGAAARPDGPRGPGAPARRVRIQDLGGALPPVGARRLPGCADRGGGAHRHRLEGGGLRGAPPRPGRACAAPGGLADGAVAARGAHDDGRQRGGARPVEREAPPRLLVDRSRRLHAGRARRRPRPRRAGGALLPGRLRGRVDGRFRHDPAPRARRARRPSTSPPTAAWPGGARFWRSGSRFSCWR